MNILMALVIAMFIITAGYVGYHASQQPTDDTGGHNITIYLEILNQGTSIQTFSNLESKNIS